MRERSRKGRSAAPRSGGAAAAIASAGSRLWAKAAQRPVDSTAIFMASAASVVIIANAVFLQSGSHPAPFFANPATQPQVADSRFTVAVLPPPRPADALSIHPPVSPRAAQQAGARRNDPIADLIGSAIGTPARVMAVQRVLSEFGYGQIKQTGVVDEATSAAIEKFETDRRLPVTGRISARLFTELAVMTGRPVE